MLFGSSGAVIDAVCVNWGSYRDWLGQVVWLWKLFGSIGVVIEAVWVKWCGSRGGLCQLG